MGDADSPIKSGSEALGGVIPLKGLEAATSLVARDGIPLESRCLFLEPRICRSSGFFVLPKWRPGEKNERGLPS